MAYEDDTKLEKFGALWNSPSAHKSVASGLLDVESCEELCAAAKSMGGKVRVMMFRNGFKKEDKHPDFMLQIQVPNDYDGAGSTEEAPDPFA